MRLPYLLLNGDVNRGSTASTGLLTFLHFKMINIAPTETKSRPNTDRTIIARKLPFVLGFFEAKFALMGSAGFDPRPI